MKSSKALSLATSFVVRPKAALIPSLRGSYLVSLSKRKEITTQIEEAAVNSKAVN